MMTKYSRRCVDCGVRKKQPTSLICRKCADNYKARAVAQRMHRKKVILIGGSIQQPMSIGWDLDHTGY